MVKILQVCPKYFPQIGGVETHVKEISERLVERGFEVDVFTTSPHGGFRAEEVINGVKVRRFKSWAPSDAYYFSTALKRYLAETSQFYDIVHAHNYHAFPALYAAQTKSKNKLIFTSHYHGTGHSFLRKILFKPYRYVGKTIFSKADKVICVSEYEKQLVMKTAIVSENKIIVIPNGVNLREFEGLKKDPKKNRAILYVGRLEKYKGVEHLIRSLLYIDSDISLEIVGKGSQKNSLMMLAKRIGVSNRVSLYQDLPRNELLQKYVNADLFALLSSNESFGVSVAEALSCKTPCIVANASALKEWVDNKNCFGLDNISDPQVVASSIKQVIGKTANYTKLTDWNDVARQVERTYNSACTLKK